jgi:hypothetical protein
MAMHREPLLSQQTRINLPINQMPAVADRLVMTLTITAMVDRKASINPREAIRPPNKGRQDINLKEVRLYSKPFSHKAAILLNKEYQVRVIHLKENHRKDIVKDV